MQDGRPGAGAYYHDGERRRVLGNGRCRIVWTRDADARWDSAYQIRVANGWETLARGGLPDSGPVQVVAQLAEGVFADRDFDRQFHTTCMWQDGPMQFTYPHQVLHRAGAAQCDTVETADGASEVCWRYALGADGEWQVESRHTVWADSSHVLERVRVTRRAAGGPVRVRCAWHVEHIPPELLSSSVKAVTHAGWRQPAGTFLVLAKQLGARRWTPLAGGGGLVNLRLGDHTPDPQQYIDGKYQISPQQGLLHQAPPCMDSQGWLELRPGDSYELAHYVIMHPEYPFTRAFIDYLHRLQPQEYLPPRYPWSHFIAKCSWTLRHTPEGYEDGGEWGLYWKNWYNLTEDPRCAKSGIEKVHSLDWGASWDIWTAYFLLLYAERYDDDWSRARYARLRNAIVHLPWQIDDPASPVDGAYWMERDEHGDFHISNWMADRYSPRTLWVCDAGKVGYFLCLLYEKTGDAVLLQRARKAAAFLLRRQQADGDLDCSVMLQEGAAIWPSNLGGVTSAVLLWAELYAVTGEQRYLEAARRAAAFSHREWLSNNRWQMHGGEIDSFGLPDSTTAMYAAMGYAALALASGEEAHQAMTRDAANYLVAQQWLFDINYGYYRKEARWNGMDCKTVGALQGWIRPECTMCLYLAFKATGDPLYRYSMEQHAAWMTYMQYDNPDSPRTFGGGHEVFEVPADQINGFGSNFWPETVGQAVAMLLLMADDEARAAAVGV